MQENNFEQTNNYSSQPERPDEVPQVGESYSFSQDESQSKSFPWKIVIISGIVIIIGGGLAVLGFVFKDDIFGEAEDMGTIIPEQGQHATSTGGGSGSGSGLPDTEGSGDGDGSDSASADYELPQTGITIIDQIAKKAINLTNYSYLENEDTSGGKSITRFWFTPEKLKFETDIINEYNNFPVDIVVTWNYDDDYHYSYIPPLDESGRIDNVNEEIVAVGESGKVFMFRSSLEELLNTFLISKDSGLLSNSDVKDLGEEIISGVKTRKIQLGDVGFIWIWEKYGLIMKYNGVDPDGVNMNVVKSEVVIGQVREDDVADPTANTPSGGDSDGDGLSDWDEENIFYTDVNNPDTDGDGYSDGQEVENGYNPLGEGKLE